MKFVPGTIISTDNQIFEELLIHYMCACCKQPDVRKQFTVCQHLVVHSNRSFCRVRV